MAPRAKSAALVIALAVAAACSSSGRTQGGAGGSGTSGCHDPCSAHGNCCGAGETCWPQDASSFSCLPSGVGKDGDRCQNFLGMPTCADGLACLTTAQSSGVCTPYCDPASMPTACPNGAPCLQAHLGNANGPTFYACVPPSSQHDGG